MVMFVLMAGNSWAAQPFALVELFSSEGCSSCPPADDLLREITHQAKVDNQRIFTLSFQVDYWNYLGWTDPFSNSEFTRRQHQYAQILRSSSVYTPQMIINGKTGFVGSDRVKAKKAIAEYLTVPSVQSISLELKSHDAAQIQLSYSCDLISADDAVIHFALVESGLQSQVTAGENQGRVLKHENIVREFKTIPLSGRKGSVFFNNPSGSDEGRFSVIAYIQNEKDMTILGADSIDIK
jgi:hypothetical protein